MTAAHIQDNFLFIALSSLLSLSHNPIRRLYRRLPLYEQNLSAGIAAFRTGNAPAILQVYEVGTATMMASKAIKPVYE
ncbi:hypothetical protein MJN51_38475, partial [Salmonella enterica subsp. enterica serovar Kentucky]|nr:hypothetical protein [Salmonella enterica subsp. enterica serovar Kentucky]